MKLLICINCQDVFSLNHKEKSCSCGGASGKYVNDIYAVYSGAFATPLGFANNSFISAVHNQPKEGNGEQFIAFVIPKECNTFEKIEHPHLLNP